VRIVKDIIRKSGNDKVKVMAKIEMRSAVENLEEIGPLAVSPLMN